MWVVGFSYFGSGLVFAYTSIFLAGRTSLGLKGAALYFGVIAVANFAGALALSGVTTPMSPGLLSGAGSILQALSYISLPYTRSPAVIALLAAVIGLGRAGSTVGITGLIASLVPEEDQRTAFARRYRAMNVGIGTGSLVASGLTALLSFRVLGLLFVANGITFLPQAWFLLRRRAVGAVSGSGSSDQPEPAPFWRLYRSAGPVSLVQLGAYLLAFSQFEATAPLVAHNLLAASLAFISLFVGLNTLAVIVLQKPFNEFLSRYRPRTGVQVALAFWTISYAVAWITWALGHTAALIGLLIFGVAFACGEAAYACSYYPWLLSIVPATESSRAASLANSMLSVGNSLGPAGGAALVSTGSADTVWGALTTACLAFGLAARSIRDRRSTPAGGSQHE